MIRVLRPKDGMAMICSGWIGTVWRGAGVNEAGVALGGSSCSAKVPEPEQFLNPHSVSAYVLGQAETVGEAIALFDQVNASTWGSNYPLIDRSGAAAIVEKAGALQGVRRAEGERLWCTNHALTPELQPYGAQSPEALQESTERYEAIDRLTCHGPLDADLARAVAAFNGRPGALCRYGDDDPRDNETEFAVLLYPARGEAEFCFSHADRDPWYRVSLAEEGAGLTRV